MSSKGYKHTDEAKIKMSLARKGKPCLAYNRPSGSKHYKWKGGISIGQNSLKYQKDRQRKIRDAAIEIMGSKCVKCGFTDARALQIDHVYGGGTKERTQFGYSIGKDKFIIKSFLSNEGKYQLLCANCNWIKRTENNEVANCGNKRKVVSN